MSGQLLVAAALAVLSAGWFLAGFLRDLRPPRDCAEGCGGCARACPLAPASPVRGRPPV